MRLVRLRCRLHATSGPPRECNCYRGNNVTVTCIFSDARGGVPAVPLEPQKLAKASITAGSSAVESAVEATSGSRHTHHMLRCKPWLDTSAVQ